MSMTPAVIINITIIKLTEQRRKRIADPCVSFVFAGPVERCAMIPVGVSDPRIIHDNQMTASSKYDGRCKAAYGRLNDFRGDGWCTGVSDSTTDWLQVDLGTTIQVCAVATQGDVDSDEWTTVFKLSYSSDENNWTTYKDANDTDMVRTSQFIKKIQLI